MSASEQIKSSQPAVGSDAVIGRLQELLLKLMDTKYIKHAIVTVESGDGSFRWVGAKGRANPDGTPMQVHTPFWIASVTKLYIAASILKLHEQGRISIEETMATYLPQSMINGLHRGSNGIDYTDKITVLHLLSHSSGLPDYIEIHTKGEKNLFDRILEDGDRSWSIAESMEIVRAVNSPLFPPQPLSTKKKKIRYSDTNFQLLIAIIEAVTGKPLNVVFDEMFYKPLNLKQTFHPGTTPTDTVSSVATVWYQDKPLDIPEAMRSFGDLNSTASDQLAFLRALIRGEVFDDPETLQLMKGEWNQFGFSLSPIAPGWPIEYGLGMMRFRIPRIFSPFRPMPEVIGHTGAPGSWLFYSPPLDVFLAGTVDQLAASAVPFQLVPKLLNVLSKHL